MAGSTQLFGDDGMEWDKANIGDYSCADLLREMELAESYNEESDEEMVHIPK